MKYLEVESIAEARSVPATDLLEAAVTFPACDWSGQGDDVVWAPMTNWIPCVDGTFLVEQYRDALIAGHRVPCDLLVGNTTGEFMVPGPDGTPYPEGECGNLDMIDAWVSGGGSEPYRYRFDVDMPGMMPVRFIRPIYGFRSGRSCELAAVSRLALRFVPCDEPVLDEFRGDR